MAFRIGVDIGGTFTDLVAIDEANTAVFSTKALTTPHALAEAVLSCIDQVGIDPANARLVIHGTTVGVNALIQRKGAATALLTTEGFRDVLEIGRGNYQRMFDIMYQRPPVLVPRRWRFEVPERLDSSGEVLTALDEDAVNAIADKLRADGVESVAVVFLFSYINPAHEKRAVELLRARLPGVSISPSHRISQEWREYERTNTTVVNAYVQPIMERYLAELSRSLAHRGFAGHLLITESNGGAFSVEAALTNAVHTLESGPAAGAIGCVAISAPLGRDRLISFDMGGTTAKCCIVEDGQARLADEYHIDGQALRIPVIDITEVSAGGGSIAWVDAGGALAVGPQSAGAAPGPACYGLGGEAPTVTDANLLLGRIAASAFLGGRMPLRLDLAEAAIRRGVAEPLGLSVPEAALAIVRLAEVKMALAVRSITTERGLDPRDYTLVAYGGSGPLHAAAIARELAIPEFAIPPSPSTFSAWGMLAADLRHDLVRTVALPIEHTDAAWAAQRFAEMTADILGIFPAGDAPVLKHAVDMRYGGQVHTVTIDVPDLAGWPDLCERFHQAHEKAYGYRSPTVVVELLNLRLTAILPIDKPALAVLPKVAMPAPHGTRTIYSSRTAAGLATPAYDRAQLGPGARIAGPAVIEEPSTTTFLDVGDTAEVNDTGFLVVQVARDGN